MSAKRFFIVGLVLFFLLGMAFARVTAQTGPDQAWEEGQAVSPEAVEPNQVWEEGQVVSPEVGIADQAFPAVATTPGTHYRTYSGGRFYTTASTLTYAASGGAIYATALPAGGYSFSLDMDLPEGATITEVVFFVIDNDATNWGLSLRSYNPETNAFIILESATTTGASSALQTIIIPVDPPIVVDNTSTSYRLRAAPGVGTSAHLLRGARVGFTVPTGFIPLITR